MKFFNTDENGYRTFIEWEKGYVKLSNDWSQFAHQRGYNWLDFKLIQFEVELDRMCGEHFSIRLSFLGFGMYIQQYIRQNEKGRAMMKEIDKIETIEENHQTQINKLKTKIRGLRSENRKLKQT